jgi:hypothetical protein
MIGVYVSYMCPHTTICVLILLYVSSYYYMCPHTMCPHTTICVSSYYYMCLHTNLCASSYCYVCVLIPVAALLQLCCSWGSLYDRCICVVILCFLIPVAALLQLCCSSVAAEAPFMIGVYASYMCPHTAICVLILLYVSSYYYVSSYHYMCLHTTICVLILLYVSSYYCMCPHTTICVLILLYVSSYYYFAK